MIWHESQIPNPKSQYCCEDVVVSDQSDLPNSVDIPSLSRFMVQITAFRAVPFSPPPLIRPVLLTSLLNLGHQMVELGCSFGWSVPSGRR